MIKKILSTLIIALAPMMFLRAQSDDYSKLIEVSREYQPTVENAEKLSIQPSAVDTVVLRPETRYQITPTLWSTPFSVSRLGHAQLSAAEWHKPGNAYLRVGGGWPLASELDLYVTPVRTRGAALGFYLNHQGFEDKLKNDMEERVSALSLENRAGLFLTARTGERTSLRAEADYSLDLYTPYGGYDYTMQYMSWGERVRYNEGRIALSFGHDFADLSMVNFRFGASALLFSAVDAGGVKGYDQLDYAFFGRVGYGSEGHSVGLDLDVEGRNGLDKLSDYRDFRLMLAPVYEFRTNGNLNLRLGVDFVYDDSPEGSKQYFLPDVDVSYRAAYEFVPYLKLDGEVGDGSYRAQHLRNPYVMAGAWTNNGVRVGGRGGANGTIGGLFSYELYGGYDLYRLYNYFVGVNASSRFDAVASSLNVAYYGGRMELHFSPALTLRGEARANKPIVRKTDDSSEEALYQGNGIRKMEADVSFAYNYRKKLSVALGVRVLGEAQQAMRILRTDEGKEDDASSPILTPMQSYYQAVELPSACDLYFDVEFRPSSRVAFYLHGANLLGQRLYDFIHYPLPGANFMVGVKMAL